MQIVIEIPEDVMLDVKNTYVGNDVLYCGVKYGTPLEDIRAEIEQIEEGISSYHNDRPWIFKDEVLEIIDKHTGVRE